MTKKSVNYGDSRRNWHPKFIEYALQMVEHPVYAGMPGAFVDEQVRWMAPSNRPVGSAYWDLHDRRKEWWQAKAEEIGVERSGKWISRVAKLIHPTKRKPCQTCGREMEIPYVYPTRRTIARINQVMSPIDQFEFTDFLTISEVAQHALTVGGEDAYLLFEKIFPLLKGIERTPEAFILAVHNRVVPTEPKSLSPGVHSNAPDRFDGFHTYNLCCREKEDTGRAITNLRTYGDDRRAYENWAEGDWATANKLMKSGGHALCSGPHCVNTGQVVQMTADHIGPISLGFLHRPRFTALCDSCNSAKGNRMSFQDVRTLLDDELNGQDVVSWQAKKLWDNCKCDVRTDDDALKLSKLLRINQHHFLHLMNHVLKMGYPDVLLHQLSPEYSARRADFKGLNPSQFTFDNVVYEDRQDTYALSKGARMTRIALKALPDYAAKKRNVQEVARPVLAAGLAEVDAALASCPDEMWRSPLNEILASDISEEQQDMLLRDLFVDGYKPSTRCQAVFDAMENYMRIVSEALTKRFYSESAQDINANLDDA